jgi:hypothetical protein
MTNRKLTENHRPATMAQAGPPAAWQSIETLPDSYDEPFIYRDRDGMAVVERTHGQMLVFWGSDDQPLEIEPGAHWAPLPDGWEVLAYPPMN